MSLGKLKILVCVFLWALCSAIFLLNVAGFVCPLDLLGTSVGNPKVLVRNNDFMCTGIVQIVADSDAIYVLFGQYGVVQVYSKTGEYSYTISIHSHMNGRTEIAAEDGLLYIKDKVNNIYVFDGRNLKEFVDRKVSSSLRNKIAFGKWDSQYCVRAGSVWHIPENGKETCIIQRAPWLSVYQGSFLWCCLAILMIISWVVLLLPDPGRTAKVQ